MTRGTGVSEEESAGRLLQSYWESAEVDTPPGELAEDAVEVRARYARVLSRDPDDVTCAVGLTVLAAATLRAHVAEEHGQQGRFQWADDLDPFPGLDGDDEYGSALADEVVRAARRTLELDAVNNLAVFALGYGLEWLGEHDAAVEVYREALRLDPCDEPARIRVEALDGDEPSPPREEPGLRHPRGFFLLEMTHMVNNAGDVVGWTWLLTDPVAVRSAAEDYFSEWVAVLNPGSRELSTFALEIHGPGHDPEYLDLTTAIQVGPHGVRTVDWSSVTMPAAVEVPLPAGQPIRRDGDVCFFGATEHWI